MHYFLSNRRHRQQQHHGGRKKQHRNKNHYLLRHTHLQLCLIILAPAYVLISSLMLIHPSFQLIFLRSSQQQQERQQHYDHYQLSPDHQRADINQLRKVPPTKLQQRLILRDDTDTEQTSNNESTMSKKRVVILSSFNSYDQQLYNTNIDSMVASWRISDTKIKDFQPQPPPSSNDNHHSANDNTNQTTNQTLHSLPRPSSSSSSRSSHEKKTIIVHDNHHPNPNNNNHTTTLEKNCIPMAKWQTMSFPTCNSVHEMNIFSPSPTLFYFDKSTHHHHHHHHNPRGQGRKDALHFHRNNDIHRRMGKLLHPISDTYSLARMLGHGWFRHAWSVTDSLGVSMAIKTLRLERDYIHEYYELHRRDAVSMERLTSSPYVMNIYGYCGQSALTELAYSEVQGMNTLYQLSTRLKGVNTPFAVRSKLQMAAMTTLGLAHIHNVDYLDDDVVGVGDSDGDGSDGGTSNVNASSPSSSSSSTKQSAATIAHYDINPRNVIISQSGKPKINDFNIAEFLTWDSETREQKYCGFESRFHEPWWRAPEEMVVYNNTSTDDVGIADVNYPKNRLSEKTDIYSLGNTLYVLLTGLEPRGKEHKRRRYENVSNVVARGEYPPFPDEYSRSTDPAIVGILEAIRLCWEPDPNFRPGAMEIAADLFAVLYELKQNSTRES